MSYLVEQSFATIVVDADNDFVHPEGSLYTPGAELIIPLINRFVIRCTVGRVPVFYSSCSHPAETSHFQQWPVHCVAGTWGAELHQRLIVAGPVVLKATRKDEDGYSALHYFDASGNKQQTDMVKMLYDAQLDACGFDGSPIPNTVSICGYVTDVCVKATVMSALELGFDVIFIPNLSIGLNPSSEKAAIEEMRDAGALVLDFNL